MGAGCWYTHKEVAGECTDVRAFWVEIPEEDSLFNETDEYLLSILDRYDNNLYDIHYEPTYYGDGLVVRMEPRDNNTNAWFLAQYHHSSRYEKLQRELIEAGYQLRMAGSAWTSFSLNESLTTTTK